MIAQHDMERQHHENEIQFSHKFQIHKALSLLVTGSCFGIFGFVFAATAGFWDKQATSGDLGAVTGIKFASGNPHFPMTVSEMVHDPSTPAGKAFLGFELIAAILILTSWYPYQLSNVYIGERHGMFERMDMARCANCISWASLRQFLPSLGLALVALVSTTPVYDRKASGVSFITCQIHILAATALFGGYILVEMQCLFVAHPQGLVKIRKTEKMVRTIVITITAITATLTIVLQFVLPYLGPEVLCCADEWRSINQTEVESVLQTIRDLPDTANITYRAKLNSILSVVTEHAVHEKKVEENSSYGSYRTLKMVCFWSEVLAGFFGLFSHTVIWYFAPERKLILEDYRDLKDLGIKEDSEDEYDED